MLWNLDIVGRHVAPTVGLTVLAIATIAFVGDRYQRRAEGSETASSTASVVQEDCDSNGAPCNIDCNTTGRPDDLEIFMGSSRDCDADRVPDECQDTAPGDLDGDGAVDADDRAILAKCHRPIPPGATGCEAADLNDDGRVDCADWSIMRCAWTGDPPPAYVRCLPAAGFVPSDP